MGQIEHIVAKAMDAAKGDFGSLSCDEKLIAALALNRPDWLESMHYTIPEALERIGPKWTLLIPLISWQIAQHTNLLNRTGQQADDESVVKKLETVDLNAEFVTYGISPGYRRFRLVFDVTLLDKEPKYRLSLVLDPKDSETIVSQIKEAHQLASDRSKPQDIHADETRPGRIN